MRVWRGWLAALTLWAGVSHLRADVIPSQPWPELGGAFLVPHAGPDLEPGGMVRAWDGSPAEGGHRLAGIGWPGADGAVACLVFSPATASSQPDLGRSVAFAPGAGGQPWGWTPPVSPGGTGGG